jgi:hypothetical protein
MNNKHLTWYPFMRASNKSGDPSLNQVRICIVHDCGVEETKLISTRAKVKAPANCPLSFPANPALCMHHNQSCARQKPSALSKAQRSSMYTTFDLCSQRSPIPIERADQQVCLVEHQFVAFRRHGHQLQHRRYEPLEPCWSPWRPFPYQSVQHFFKCTHCGG